MIPSLRPTRPALAALLALTAAATRLPAQRVGEVGQRFELLCSACHGGQGQGGSGPSLVDDVWLHGSDDAAITKQIREGNVAMGMPAYAAALSEAETRAMVVYLREIRARAELAAKPATRPRGDQVVRSTHHAFRVEPVLEGLGVVWALAWLPDGRMLVTEREGRLRIVADGKLLPDAVRGTPKVWANGQGGLMEVAPHPDYATNGWIYLGYSDPGANGSALTAVVRGRLKDGAWVDEETIYRAAPALYKRGGVHFGTRFVFQDGYLFFPIGERGDQNDAQSLARANGKVHRVHDDGRVPADNPFVNTPGALPTIWSYGHRNPQGLVAHPVTRALWDTEHGPRGGDELNLVLPGRNYGWPVITYGMNYDGTPITDRTAQEGMEQPVLHWTPSIAVCGIEFYTGTAFPRWKNDLFVTGLGTEELRRLRLDDAGKVIEQELLFKGIGRARDVGMGPDGLLYVGFDQGRVIRLVPAE